MSLQTLLHSLIKNFIELIDKFLVELLKTAVPGWEFFVPI